MTVLTCQRCSTDTEAIERHGIDWLCPTCAHTQNSIAGRTTDFNHFVQWNPVSLSEMQRDGTQRSLEGYV